MKTTLLLITTVLLFLGSSAQDYWATHLPDVSTWNDYLDEGIFYMDTTTSPTVVKIDPSQTDPSRDYDSWRGYATANGSVDIPSNTILLWKSGTTDTLLHEISWSPLVYGERQIRFNGCHDVFVGTYGGTERVKIFSDQVEANFVDSHKKAFRLTNGADRIWVDNIELTSEGAPYPWPSNADEYRYPYGHMHSFYVDKEDGHTEWFDKLIISRCYFNKVGEILGSGNSETCNIDTVVVYNCKDDEVLAEGFTGEFGNLRFYDNTDTICKVNYKAYYHPQGHLDTKAGGDGIQISFGANSYEPGRTVHGPGSLVIWNSVLDRSVTKNKFTVFISHKALASGDPNANILGSYCIIKNSTIIPPVDTAGGAGSNCFDLNMVDSVYMINNKITGGNNPYTYTDYWPGTFYNISGRRFLWFEGNVVENLTQINIDQGGSIGWGGVSPNGAKTIKILNNTFVDNRTGKNYQSVDIDYFFLVGSPNGMTWDVENKNNLWLLNDTRYGLKNGFPLFSNTSISDTSNCQYTNGGSESWDSYYGISNWEGGNLTPTVDGRLHDNGTTTSVLSKYSGALNNTYDQNGTLRFSGEGQDIGALEYAEGVQSNLPPVILNQTFSVDENSPANQLVGTVEATDPDAGQSLTFSIQGGNTDGAFFINSGTGELSVANSSAVNFEQISEFSLIVKVQDNGPGYLSDQATITVNLNDVNEVPVINNQSFAIEQTIGNGELVGMVEASDPDEGQVLSFSITAGNADGAFQIDAGTGELTVADNSVFDISVTPEYYLTVLVEDNGSGALTDDATITVTLEEVNFAPVIDDQDFTADENIAAGTEVGMVAASDPNAGQTISYSILSGNTDGAFDIASTTGRLTVLNTEAVNFEVNPEFTLVIQVEDDGLGNLTDEANVTITINDVNEPPVMEDQNYVVEESIANGELVGVVDAEDPDQGQVLTFSITGGNEEGAFALNSSTGELTIADNSVLNFVSTPIYFLEVEVEDDGAGNLTDAATIAVSTDEVNQAPVIEDQSFTLEENSPSATVVGNVVAMDPDAGQTLTYSIVSGNALGAFQIDALTGALSVNTASVINFEENPSFALVVKVEDDGIGNLTDEATVNVNLSDVNEAPVVESSTINLEENSAVGMEVGTVEAEDPDNGQSLTYAIISGNIDGAFSIDESNGTLTINNQGAVNFEATEVFYLVIEVEDNGAGNLSDQGVVTITIEDINETPEIEDQYFSVQENSVAGTEVGEVIAVDPDNGQSLTYFITSGNIQDAFTIDPNNGMITVQNQAALDITVNPVFILNVEVVDNGSGNLSDEASVVIALMGATSVYEATGVDFECQIYPNPARDNVNLVVKNMETSDLNVKIIDFMGQIVFEEDYSSPDKQFETKINLETYSEGLYVIFLSNGDKLEKVKMIKQ